ncbi:MAG TPA: hypothetical protein VK592_10370, partial [Candidatus Dormibacteraeota bacterium]|nr:hypothetical protein [Candidatus Dormibacteraeota bacterium]
MASTDQRAGFRLPWSGSTPQDEQGAETPGEAMPEAHETMTDAQAAAPAETTMTAGASPEPAVEHAPEARAEMAAPAATHAASTAPSAKPARFVT